MSTEASTTDKLRTLLAQDRALSHVLIQYLEQEERAIRTAVATTALGYLQTGDDLLSRQGLHALGKADALKELKATVAKYAKIPLK
jgi:hypothetical protein